MPTFQGQVTPEQLIQIISYIKSLQISNPQSTTPAAPAAKAAPASQTGATPAPNKQ
jgi:hypothetical protein